MGKEGQPIDIESTVLKTKGVFNPESLSKELDVDSKTVISVIDALKEKGFGFIDTESGVIRTKAIQESGNFDARKLFKGGLLHFGVVSDTHLGSKKERVDALEKMYDKFSEDGIKTVFHAGDWTDGVGVYRGQEFEVNKFGQEEQIQYLIDQYPKRAGIQTIGISGNHDLRSYEHGGCDPLIQIARARKDIKYLGQYNATVRIGDRVNLEMSHPLGNVSYALSYKAQREINNRSPDNLPNVLIYGHYHTSYYMHYRGIDFIQTPCFKDQGNFEKRLGLNPTIGGWIVDGKSNGESISDFTPRLITFNSVKK